MNRTTPLKKSYIIGKQILSVSHIDLRYDNDKNFQERLILIELESGLRFTLQQESNIIDTVSKVSRIYPYSNSNPQVVVLRSDAESNLRSPIKALAIPFGWKDSCAVILQNGFALYDGFSSRDNGVLFVRPAPETRASLVEFHLPD